MIIKAKKESGCTACNATIAIGALVHWRRYSKTVRHVTCPEGASLVDRLLASDDACRAIPIVNLDSFEAADTIPMFRAAPVSA